MPFFQPRVPALSSSIDLTGKTAIVTGATAGIGLEICRQYLISKLSNLVVPARNLSKGERVKQALLSDPAVKAANPTATIKVIQLDTETYSSAQRFATDFKAEFSDLHLLILNAGIGTHEKEMSSTGHEKDMQVNFLSNVLLTLALLPTLEATADKTGEPTRVTWTGSRVYLQTSLADESPSQGLLKYIDNTDLPMLKRYANSKALCLFFQLELAKQYKPDKVIINSFCPGLVHTGMTDGLPIYLRIPMAVLNHLKARAPEKAGWIALNASVLVGAESHGRLMEDMDIGEPCDFVKGKEGQRLQKLLWNEIVDEMAGIIDIPACMIKVV
ncbi:hypothetical protein FDECE_6084 [Fusarium decemcellulare]|nr:hypothetical protein FDECE_6084 [Fusarium decemcellulare]